MQTPSTLWAVVDVVMIAHEALDDQEYSSAPVLPLTVAKHSNLELVEPQANPTPSARIPLARANRMAAPFLDN